jgi:hypothetical protein
MNSLTTHIIQNELFRKGVSDYMIEDKRAYNVAEISLSEKQFAVVYEVVLQNAEIIDAELHSAINSVTYDMSNSFHEGTERYTRIESDIISVHYSKIKVESVQPILIKYALITY